ncbi:hypothetical protein LO772_12000 [Yinghuangia sp. ASG 101]|uniref:hypothetical protein n=1 Tax=Yinghuangia sp. ASG 101 TaxID=2896848 RepID=UPI001E5A3FD7|nr:hypothetical protein [Yinghuangia sp. ASG 101]UGQ14245.1 hypothetical protein LO772_12000 [Yinghuangia sp. ASG 101]
MTAEGDYSNPWLYVVALVIMAYALWRTTRREVPRPHDNWVRLAQALDGRPDVTVRTRDDMPVHEVQRVAWMLGYQHISSESAPRGFTRHRVLRRPGTPDVPRTVPKGWWK